MYIRPDLLENFVIALILTLFKKKKTFYLFKNISVNCWIWKLRKDWKVEFLSCWMNFYFFVRKDRNSLWFIETKKSLLNSHQKKKSFQKSLNNKKVKITVQKRLGPLFRKIWTISSSSRTTLHLTNLIIISGTMIPTTIVYPSASY